MGHHYKGGGGSKGGEGRPRSKFFQFHAVLGKFGEIVCWQPSPHPEGWRPYLGEMLDPPLKG